MIAFDRYTFVNEFDLLIFLCYRISDNFITKVLSFAIFNYYIIDIPLFFIF